ncbi:MAG TPA: hypothetical protein PKH02_05745 [Bacteroidales bacterium]|nr:hypothetical protein [Bacteroidales bacterium]HPT12349.1 hypothetical protein [Bacteroidales bacterium]
MKTCFSATLLFLITLVAYGQEESTPSGIGSGNTKWKVGAGIYTGYNALTGDLLHYFNNNVPFGLSAQVQYGIVVFDFNGSIAFSHLANDIYYDGGVWESDSWVSTHYFNFALGLNIGDPRSVSLTPFAGIGVTSFVRTQLFKDEDYEPGDGELGDTFTYSFGMNMDIFLTAGKSSGEGNTKGQMSTYLRLGYAYSSPQFEKKYDDFGGRMHFFTIGIFLLGNL